VGGSGGVVKSPTIIAQDAYDKVLPYTIEVGTTSHLEKYLTELLGKVTISEWTRSQHVQHPQLLELLLEGAVQTKATDVDDLIAVLDIKYLWVVPPNKQVLLLSSHQYDLGLKSELRSMSKRTAGNISDDAINKLTILSKTYYKFKSNYAKKPISVIRKAKDKAYELDYIGIAAPIKYLVGCAVPGTSIHNKLRDIDLMYMYPKDPTAVREFIRRIKRESDIIEGMDKHNINNKVESMLNTLENERAVRNLMRMQQMVPQRTQQPARAQQPARQPLPAPTPTPLPRATGQPQISRLTGKPVPPNLQIPAFKPSDASLLANIDNNNTPKKRMLSV